MSRLAAQTLDLAIARFPAALLPAGGADSLRRATPHLAPGLQLYFECRLAGEDRSIDLSQHLFAAQGGADSLRDLARRQARAPGAPAAWTRLDAFAAAWPTEPAIVEIGLEHDQTPGGDWVGAPAVFAAFETSVLDDRPAGERFIAAVAPEGAEAWRRLVEALECAASHGLTPGRMVGVMLSRDAQLRCMIRGLSPPALRRFLADIAWPGEVDPLLALLAEAPLAGAATRLVLGFTPEVSGDCGVEVIHDRDPAGVAALRALLDWLPAQGLADPERVAALADWPGAMTPLDPSLAWPDALIARDLAGPGQLDYFNAFISHVKLNITGGRPRPAKAYLGFAPVHRRTGGDAHA